jgi:hypothetical protein
MKIKQLFLSSAMMSLLSIVTGCGSGGGGADSSSGGSGTLSLALQDAFSESYKAVYVTIKEVQVCKGSNPNNDCDWQVVATPGKTYNLLDLVNGVREQLGIAELEAGSYTQMRLIIGSTHDNGINLLNQFHPFANYVIINSSNEIHELKIPSGFQTGIKIVHGFVIEENATTELVLDFDASKSVVRAGASGNWLLKPTIKVLEIREGSIVSGTVFEDIGGSVPNPSPLKEALVSAQQIPSDNPEVIASTISDEDGNYALFINPGTYNIVGSKTGFDPACLQITTEAGVTYPGTNLILIGPKPIGIVTGTVSVTNGDPDQPVTISFRKTLPCGSESVVVEVKSVNLANGGTYSEELTSGDYTVRASTTGLFLEKKDVSVTEGLNPSLDFTLE